MTPLLLAVLLLTLGLSGGAAALAHRAYRHLRARADDQDRRIADLNQQLQERDALYEVSQALGCSLGVSDMMTRLSTRLGALVPLSSCALFLNDDDRARMRCQFASGVDADLILRLTMSEGQWTVGWPDGTAPPPHQVHPGASLGAISSGDERTVLASAMMCPLVFTNRFVGILAVYHTGRDAYTDDHRRLLLQVADQAAAVVHHALVFERTQEDALRDPLTGLFNARYAMLHVSRELARARRAPAPIALFLLDLDGFKDINDRWGHHVGDRALRAVGTALQKVIRRYDVCVRYAGDEFVVVLFGCDTQEAERKRVELQRAVDEAPFETAPGGTVRLAISAGLAVHPTDGGTFDELLAAADSRMYKDKGIRKLEVRSTK